jgi:putative aminopeptidase FrvX
VPAVLVPRERYLTATEAQPALAALSLDFGSESLDDTRALGVAPGQSVTVRKSLLPLGASRAAARSMDDRSGSTALLLVLRRIDPARVPNRVTFAWSVEEETSLSGASHLAGTVPAETVFAVDTFVSSDTPVETRRVAGAVLGRGAVLRALDSRTIVTPADVDSIVAVARDAKVPLQIGATGGATDASVFSAIGAIDVGLSWPGRYSHSPVEVVDLRDLDALVRLIAALVAAY